MTNDFEAFPRVLAALKICDKADWMLADALMAEIPAHVRPATEKLLAAQAWLAVQGHEVSLGSLTWKRNAALAYPPNTRVWNAPLGVYHEMVKGSDPQHALMRMTAFMEHCSKAHVRPTPQAARRFLEKPAVRYTPQTFVKMIMDSPEETQERVLDDLASKRAEKKKAAEATATPESNAWQSAKSAISHLCIGGTMAGNLIERHVVDSLDDKQRGELADRLRGQIARLELIINVVEGRQPSDEEIVQLLQDMRAR